MKVILNRSGKSLKIPEIKKEIPWDGKRYILDDVLVQKYRGFLEVVDLECENKLNSMKIEKDNLKLEINDLKQERDNFRKLFENLSDNCKSKTIDFLYSFQFNKDRVSAIERLRNSIKSICHQNVRICVCDTSEKSIKNGLNGLGKIEYYHHPLSAKIYNKSKTINIGVKNLIKTDYFLISDIDLIYPPNFIKNMQLLISNCKNPIRVVFNNTNLGFKKAESYQFCKDNFRKNLDQSRNQKGIAPGNGLIYRESFDKILGFDERYVGYGPEDADFNYRIQKICKYIVIDLDEFNTFHLFHLNSENTNRDQSIKNSNLYKHMVKMDKKQNFSLIKSEQIEAPLCEIKPNLREILL